MIPSKDHQLFEITNVLESVANQRYDSKLAYSTNDDFYNAVANAINTLIENLEDRVVEKTLLQESERRLTASKERLNQTLEQAIDAVITLDQDKTIVFYNEAAERIFGYSKKEVLNKNVSVLIPLEYRRRYTNFIDQSLLADPEKELGRTLSEFNLVQKGGAWFWGSISLSRIIYKEDILLTIFIKDISKRRRHQDNIRRINRLLKEKNKSDSVELDRVNIIMDLIFGNLPVQFLAFDKSGELLYTKGADLLNIIDRIQSENIRTVFRRNENIEVDFGELLEGQKQNFVMEHNSKFLDVSLSPNYDGDGMFMHFGGIIVDASDIMLAQLKMEEAYEREKEFGVMKSNFVTGASHQFRTPLTNIKNNFDILKLHVRKGKLPSKKETDNIVSRVSSAVQDITGLLSDMLSLSQDDSKMVQSSMKNLCINKICEDRLKTCEPNNLKIIGTPRDVILDPHTFGAGLSEVFDNAHKFSKSKSFDVTIEYKSDSIIITVKDQGIGVAKNELEKIFEPYHRAEEAIGYQGKGTGLTMAKKYFYYNRATISAKSYLKKGTTINIHLIQ